MDARYHCGRRRQTAKARWRAITSTASWVGEALWGEGGYENQHVKDGGLEDRGAAWYQGAARAHAAVGHESTGDTAKVERVDVPIAAIRRARRWPDTYVPLFSLLSPALKTWRARRGRRCATSSAEFFGTELGGLVAGVARRWRRPTGRRRSWSRALAARAAALKRELMRCSRNLNAIKRLERERRLLHREAACRNSRRDLLIGTI